MSEFLFLAVLGMSLIIFSFVADRSELQILGMQLAGLTMCCTSLILLAVHRRKP